MADDNNKSDGKLFGKYGDLTRLLIGFALTTVIGGALGIHFQNKSWRYQNDEKRYEAEITRASEIFDDLSHLLDRRTYRTRRLILAYRDNTDEDIKKWRDSYQEVLIQWNESLNRNLTLTQRYFGDDMRNKLDDIREEFRKTDNALTAYRKAEKHNQNDLKDIENGLDSFNYKIYGFNIEMLKHIQDGKVGIYVSP